MARDAVRSSEDREPKIDICEPQQEWNALSYNLVVRGTVLFGMKRLVIRHYEDGREQDWVCYVDGRSLT